MPKKSWTPEADQLLINYVNQYINTSTRIKWKTIGLAIGKSSSSCFSRYTRCLSPDVIQRNREWELYEDSIIKTLKEQNKTWSQIKKYLPGRSDLSIFNRWNSLLKKNNDTKSKTTNINSHQPSIDQLLQVALEHSVMPPSDSAFTLSSPFNSPSCTSSEYSESILSFSDDEVDCDDCFMSDDVSPADIDNNIAPHYNQSISNYESYDHLNYRMNLDFLTNSN